MDTCCVLQIYIYIYINYVDMCFTGKYTTRENYLIHKNYIRDPSGLFSII